MSYNVAMLLLGVLSIFNILLVLVEAEKEILILKNIRPPQATVFPEMHSILIC